MLKDFALERLRSVGVDVRPVIDPTRPTTNKNAILVGNYRLLKVDTLDNRSITDDILAQLVEAIRGDEKADCGGVQRLPSRHLQSPHDTAAHRSYTRGHVPRRRQPSSLAPGAISPTQEFDLITPNEREARSRSPTKIPAYGPSPRALYDAAAARL